MGGHAVCMCVSGSVVAPFCCKHYSRIGTFEAVHYYVSGTQTLPTDHKRLSENRQIMQSHFR